MDADSEDGRWLTYGELAEARGISKASATRMSFRFKWRRQAGNDGLVRVFVPASALHGKPNGSDMDRMADAIEAAIMAFREQEEAEKGRTERAEARADQAERRSDQERQRADRAEAARDGERSRADALRDRLDAAQAEAAAARQVAEGLRHAEAARKARGRWERIRAALRGE